MRKRKLFCLSPFVLAILLASNLIAQDRYSNYSLGISATGMLKLPVWHNDPKSSSLFSRSLNVSFYTEGIETNNFCMLIKAGLFQDKLSNWIATGNHFNYYLNSVYVNPQIALPTKYYNVKILCGFGVDWFFLGGAIVEQSSVNANRGFTVDLEAAAKDITENGRRLIPYLSGGLYFSELPWTWGKRVSMEIGLKQSMLNYFVRPTQVAISNNVNERALNLTRYIPFQVAVTIVLLHHQDRMM